MQCATALPSDRKIRRWCCGKSHSAGMRCRGEDARAYISKKSVQQEFPVALRAQDRRLDDIGFNTLQGDKRLMHFLDGSLLCFRIAHDTPLTYLFPANFKLWLDQHDNLAAVA